MAYVSKETKARLVTAAKAVIPAGWKVTFAVRHHSTIVATISKAPAAMIQADYIGNAVDGFPVNHYHLDQSWKGETLKTLEALRAALMIGNHDRSDSQSDYFDVGWYLTIQFGKWDKPCRFV